MFNIYQYHSRPYVEDLRQTLKGTVEHKVFALFLTASSAYDMDKYLQRLLDIRFERKKCEAKAQSDRYHNDPEVIARRAEILETVKRVRAEYEAANPNRHRTDFEWETDPDDFGVLPE